MARNILSSMKSLLKPLVAIALVVALVFAQADSALAARSGGRIGGGSFRAPRSFSPPSRNYNPPRGGGYGGGFGFPFLIPFFGGGGFGGLFGIFIIIALANFLLNSFRNASEERQEQESTNPTVSISRLRVGLLAEARGLQQELENLGRRADTESAQGRARVLQESTLALLRHPEYWVYAGADTEQSRLNNAESQFNQWSLAERSKFSEETFSNYNSQVQSRDRAESGDQSGELAKPDPGEYIVVTIVAAAEGRMQLPKVNSSEDLRQALRQLGGIGSEQLFAVEVLWTPQAEGDTLTSDDLVAGYPDLTLI